MQAPLNQPAIMASWSAAFFTKLHRYKALIKRRWWVLALCVGLALCYQSFKIFRSAPVYVSSSRMMVAPRMATQEKALYTEEMNNFFGTQIELMQSGEVNRRAGDRVRATKPELPQSAVMIRAFQSPKTSIFALQATGGEPLYTQAFLDAAMEEFTRYKEQMREQTSDKTLATLMEELLKVEKEYKLQEEQLFAFQKDNDVVVLKEQGNTAGEYLVKLEKEVADKRKEFQLLDTILQGISKEKTGDSTSTNKTDTLDTAGELFKEGPEADYQKAKKEIDFKKNQLKELSVNLKPQHPKLSIMREDIARMERLLEVYRTQGMGRLQARRDSLNLDITNTEKLMVEWQVKALDANRRMVQYDQLKAARDLTRTTREQLLGTVQNINVASSTSQSTISILEYASNAASVKKGVVGSLGLALVAGFVVGCGILFLLDRIDDRVNSFTELKEQFEEQVLGQIPLETIIPGQRVPVLSQNDERQIYAEAFRNIRSSLMYMAMEGDRPKTLLITSAIPNEGKSTVACNLAATLAFSGSKVLLIDADLRKGLIHADLNVPSSPGLSEVLSQQISWRDAIRETVVENLSFIPRGKTLSHVGELVLSPAADLLIRETRDVFDYVVYDSPPIMATDDTPSLAPKMDGVLMVMRASHTSSRLTHNSLDILYQRQVNILGLVFNCIDTNLPDYYHYSYYKYYYTPTS